MEDASTLVFTLKDIIQLLVFAFSVGGLFANVRNNTNSIRASEKRIDKIEGKFLKAVEDLGTNIASLTTELKTVLAVHEVRLDKIEEERH